MFKLKLIFSSLHFWVAFTISLIFYLRGVNCNAERLRTDPKRERDRKNIAHSILSLFFFKSKTIFIILNFYNFFYFDRFVVLFTLGNKMSKKVYVKQQDRGNINYGTHFWMKHDSFRCNEEKWWDDNSKLSFCHFWQIWKQINFFFFFFISRTNYQVNKVVVSSSQPRKHSRRKSPSSTKLSLLFHRFIRQI